MSRVHLPVIGASSSTAAATALPTVIPGAPGANTGVIPADPLLDVFARRIRYLRISVTDRCNYRCTYCMPEDLARETEFQPKSMILSFEEITRLVQVFAKLGVRKIRLTGGEPTVRRGIVDLVGRIAAVPGIEQVVMTSNGHLLDDLSRPLVAAGLSAVNISIDSLDPEKFARLTSRGDLSRVLAGFEAAVAAGLRVKLNAVALSTENADELGALCNYAWQRGATPRFIEHMPMSGGQLYETAAELSSREIRRRLEAEMGPLVPSIAESAEQAAGAARRDAGPARYWRVAARPEHEVGIISAMTDHFCDDCNRLRLTATGDLHACLGHDDAISLRDVMRQGGTDDDLVRAIAASVTGKRAGHEFQRSGTGGPQKHMIGIGG